MKRFLEAQFLLANHETCLILEKMFDFKNVRKQFYFTNNMALGKITDKEKQTLISFYKQNPILWYNADPKNYRNKVKRSLIKVKLVTLFDGKFEEVSWFSSSSRSKVNALRANILNNKQRFQRNKKQK